MSDAFCFAVGVPLNMSQQKVLLGYASTAYMPLLLFEVCLFQAGSATYPIRSVVSYSKGQICMYLMYRDKLSVIFQKWAVSSECFRTDHMYLAVAACILQLVSFALH
jgi:hypothetical protein